MIRGKHTIGVGFDFRRFVEARNLSGNFLGGYGYTNNNILNNSTGCTTPSGLCGTGNEVADFLLGYYNGANTFQPGPFSDPKIAGNLNKYVFTYIAPYVQDDWKVTNRLTLNLGLRWDYRSVPYEQSNKFFWIDDQNLPGGSRFTGGGLCFADPELATNGVAPAGNGFYNYCGRKNPADGSKTPFAPRIGFAYRPFGGSSTVVRGGYGIFWDSSLSREIDDSGDLYPFVTRTQLSPNSQPAAVAPKLTDQLFPAQTAIVPITSPNSQFVAVIQLRPSTQPLRAAIHTVRPARADQEHYRRKSAMLAIEACICWIASVSIRLRSSRALNSLPARRHSPGFQQRTQPIWQINARSLPGSRSRTSPFPDLSTAPGLAIPTTTPAT